MSTHITRGVNIKQAIRGSRSLELAINRLTPEKHVDKPGDTHGCTTINASHIALSNPQMPILTVNESCIYKCQLFVFLGVPGSAKRDMIDVVMVTAWCREADPLRFID